MNYEFHVGDYVESNNGTGGYITKVDVLYSSAVDGDVVHLEGALTADVSCGLTPFSLDVPTCDIRRFFNRIGAYDFTKKEKKKIEKLNIQGYLSTQTVASVVNELVDAVNKLMDKEDE